MRPDPHPSPVATGAALVLDVGTTWTKAAVGRHGRITRLATFPTEGARWRSRVAELLARAGPVDHVAVASVAPAATLALRALAGQVGPEDAVRFVTAASAPLAIDYRPADALGADRIADATAAVAGWGAPVVVVDVGTAVTCDVVGRDGRFAGGAIAPGPVTAYRALADRIPRLASTALFADCDPPLAGASTGECLRTGVLRGAAGLVDGLVHGQQRLVGPCPVVVTGGLGPLVARLGETATAVDPDLTLRGTHLACRAAEAHGAPAA